MIDIAESRSNTYPYQYEHLSNKQNTGGNPNMPATSNPPSYNESLFENRESEVEAVTQRIASLLQGRTVTKRTLIFTGDRGKGKTWLSLHLHRTVLPEKAGVTSLLYLFDRTIGTTDSEKHNTEWTMNSAAETEPTAIVDRLVRWTAQRLDALNPEDAYDWERTQWIVDKVRQQQQKVFVFLLDSISETQKELTETLEKRLLRPLTSLPNTIFVMTGRPPLPMWVSPDLRVNVALIDLEQFPNEKLKLLIAKQVPNAEQLIDQVIRLSNGNPGLARRLAERLADEQGLESVLNEVLDDVLSMYGNPKDKQNARRAAEALCVLQPGFREEEIQLLMATRIGVQEDEYAIRNAREIRDLLMDKRLLSWDKEAGGYRLDDTVRILSAEYLSRCNRSLWISLHKSAAEYYEKSAIECGEQAAEFYRRRAEHHRTAAQEKT
jgi:hypothetical protein